MKDMEERRPPIISSTWRFLELFLPEERPISAALRSLLASRVSISQLLLPSEPLRSPGSALLAVPQLETGCSSRRSESVSLDTLLLASAFQLFVHVGTPELLFCNVWADLFSVSKPSPS